MVKWTNLPPRTLALYIGVLVQIPAAPFLIQFPASVLEKGAKDGHVGDEDGVSGSWLPPSPNLAEKGTGRWNVGMYLTSTVFQINT